MYTREITAKEVSSNLLFSVYAYFALFAFDILILNIHFLKTSCNLSNINPLIKQRDKLPNQTTVHRSRLFTQEFQSITKRQNLEDLNFLLNKVGFSFR